MSCTEIAFCAYCARGLSSVEAKTCQKCHAISYCSEFCQVEDFRNIVNPDHSHESWCGLMCAFMISSDAVMRFPFSFADQTTCKHFSSDKLFRFLRHYGVFNLGLWKYLFNASRDDHGNELHLWDGLIYSGIREFIDPSVHPDLRNCKEEMALLNAYSNPTEAVLLSLRPAIAPSLPTQKRLLSVNLMDWNDFYTWRGLPLSSPAAFLLHWPLTIYYILNILLPMAREETIQSILSKNSLTIHIIGAETEVDLLPVFKELDYLISPDVWQINLVFVGPNISPSAHCFIWYLSSRFRAKLWRGVYHDYVKQSDPTDHPEYTDLIIGFNAGLSVYPTWTDTLYILAKQVNPVFFTDACQYSCLSGIGMLKKLQLLPETCEASRASELSSLTINPFRSPIRIPSTGTNWPWFSNAFIYSPFVDLSLNSLFLNLQIQSE